MMKAALLSAIATFGLGGCQAERTTEEPVQNELADLAASDAAKAAAPAGPGSQFTSIDPAKCQLLEENVEEGGWSRRLCPGPSGYKLELTDSDLRQDIIVIPADGERTELGLTEIVANGAFNALGKTAEWRGTDAAGPTALIVRLGVAADPEGRRPDISNLVVVRLRPSACIVAVVPPEPGQNEAARTIADAPLPNCFKRQ